ncbi:MAG: hypothetical protein ABS42_00305, partial [Bdellovibrio sp. SCN 50-8]
MATVGDFLKFLNAPQNQLSPVALTYKNYFQYLYDPQEELEIDALQSFIDSALTYPHWQQNRKDLHEDGLALLTSFLGASQAANLAQTIDWPQDMQIFEIEKAKTALEVLNNYWSFRLKHEGAKFRLVEGDEKTYLAIILHSDNRLTVRQYDNRFVIRNGHIEPLRRDLMLVYNDNLELDPTIMQKFEISPFTVARFYREENSVHGSAVRGYVFQHLQNFHGQVLENLPRLFFSLKRIEQNFIRRDTDPYYIQMVESLERLLHWMRLGEPVKPAQLHESLLKAQTALEEVFHGDKMLTLLLRDLEHLTARQQLQEPQTWNRTTDARLNSQLSSRANIEARPSLKPAAKPPMQPKREVATAGFASIKPSRTVASHP